MEIIKKTKEETKIEKYIEFMQSQQRDAILKTYERAVVEEDKETAASAARQLRNQLLAEADCHMVLDRMGLQKPKGEKFEDFLPFLNVLADAAVGEWAKYRKALRDLPEQENFPFEIEWPESPDKKEQC